MLAPSYCSPRQGKTEPATAMCDHRHIPKIYKPEVRDSLMRLKYAAVYLVLLALLAFAGVAPAFAKTVLPDACGDNKIEFEIKTMKDQPPPTAPEAGKALIVFVGTVPGGAVAGLSPVRFGLDGAWAGATKNKSYFVASVAPAEHHLCAVAHAGAFKAFKWAVPLDMTAEADKVYYYEASVTVTMVASNPMIVGGGAPGQPPPTVVGGGGGRSYSFSFVPLSDAEGKYRVKAWELSTSTPKH